MSHHLDTPLAGKSGQLFIDDLYVFQGEGSTVFIMDVNSDVNGHHAEPGFHPEARYEIKVHFDGAGYEELTYRVSFGAAEADGQVAVARDWAARRAAVRPLDEQAARELTYAGEREMVQRALSRSAEDR